MPTTYTNDQVAQLRNRFARMPPKEPDRHSLKEVIRTLAVEIRQMIKNNYSIAEIHEILMEEFGRECSLETFRAYCRENKIALTLASRTARAKPVPGDRKKSRPDSEAMPFIAGSEGVAHPSAVDPRTPPTRPAERADVPAATTVTALPGASRYAPEPSEEMPAAPRDSSNPPRPTLPTIAGDAS